MFLIVILITIFMVAFSLGQTNVDNDLVGHWALGKSGGTISFHADHTFDMVTSERLSGIWETYSFNSVPFVQLRYYGDSPRENFGIAVMNRDMLYFKAGEADIAFYLYRL